MSLVHKDRIKEGSTTTGTGPYALAGAISGYQSFAQIGNGNTCYYCATDGLNWEVGLGTYTTAGPALARTAILESSNAGAAVSWAAGTRQIFCTYPAERAVPTDYFQVIADSDGRIIPVLEDHATYTNEGATALAVFILPGAAAGLEYCFIVQDTDGLAVQVAAGDTINLVGTVYANGIQCAVIGSTVTLKAINATEWIATELLGTWLTYVVAGAGNFFANRHYNNRYFGDRYFK